MKTLSHTDLITALANAGYGNASIQLADGLYQPPTCEWLLTVFYPWFKEVLFSLSLTAYKPESEDCDDFADLFSVFARICHRRTTPDSGTGFPVGILWYASAQGYHAVTIAVTSDHGLVVIEPQNGDILKLTPEEVASAQLVKI